MPTIYDNIEKNLLEGLKQALQVSQRADACVGYLNLRGWGCIADEIDALPANDSDNSACRLIVGMSANADRVVRNYYGGRGIETTQQMVVEDKKRFAEGLARQLTYGVPTAKDETGLRKLAEQLRSGRLTVKFFGAHPLHAKLYLGNPVERYPACDFNCCTRTSQTIVFQPPRGARPTASFDNQSIP